MKSPDDKPQISDLRALLALIKDGTVTSAAVTLGVTQSTMSYQLDGMRKRFSDQLFVRVGNRMSPTPFALSLVDPASRVLRIMDTEIANLSGFDPLTTEREFRLGVNEIGAMTMVPKLIHSMARLAPKAKLIQMHLNPDNLAGMLERGEMDVAAGHIAYSNENLIQRLLYKRDYAFVARVDHPRIGAHASWRQISREGLLLCPLIPATNAWFADQLKRAGLTAGPIMTTQHVSAIPFIVASSDLVAIVPREAYLLLNPAASLKNVRLPRAIPPITIHQYWHPLMASDPGIRFFRDLIYACAHEN